MCRISRTAVQIHKEKGRRFDQTPLLGCTAPAGRLVLARWLGGLHLGPRAFASIALEAKTGRRTKASQQEQSARGQWGMSGKPAAAVRSRPSARRSCGRGRCRPRRLCLGPELPEGGSADQMALDVEGIVDGGMGGEEPLG
jgi:hypothetical protein